jgi:hypothetical protein
MYGQQEVVNDLIRAREDGAIARKADEVFERQLSPLEQQAARSIFVQLVRPGQGAEDTRRSMARNS